MSPRRRLARAAILVATSAVLAAFGFRWVHSTSSPAGGPGAEAVELPDGWILYSDGVRGEELRAGESRALFRRRADGSDVTRLTFDGQDDASPRLMDDGRILFERRFRYPDPSRAPAWMTIHPDGTQIALYRDGTRPAPERDAADPRPPILTSVVKGDRATGTLLCLDVYASRLPGMSELPRGAIRKVVVNRAGGPANASIAEAPVESDGSFFVEVPADTPLRLTLLGPGDEAVASLDSGIWVRPNENRGCIGCHEPPDMAPENRRPLALVHREHHAY